MDKKILSNNKSINKKDRWNKHQKMNAKKNYYIIFYV